MSCFENLMIGQAPALKTQLRAAALAAATDVPILIEGESGTGKDLLAQAIHRESRRAGAPFVAVNCASLPDGLVESLLYGHRRGAFTGAVSDQTGYVQQARGGSLFLDEVGELPGPAQAKLLRFLETRECLPLGQAAPERVELRVLAASNRDLAADVAAGRFRQDLFYRLNVVPVQMPPLRERREDIPALVDYLTVQLSRQHELAPPRYSAATLSRLQDYAWPGNVRELRNLCERLLILFSGREVQPSNLPAELRTPQAASRPGFALPAGGVDLGSLESDLIQQALAQAGGNRSRAARLLGLTRDTLLYRIKKWGIEC
ncbi:sigma-54 interaction domain-containing protein [Thiohalobacter thiocyanaticus]|uniref:Sigma-54-dependent Fis family transcriptional regulator n=1 Tax=Thiohalobacter thiocyanaticus TaxID=585455 RepID=A0A426QJU2_9GAMM|nr:sigma-54 dependent transcriptional regulator [Thiohalobacter thiocyanaticus]RRQ22018.1 sigma-54-dependent Fis family transcriptional regulator [Thiohalobacter thiocyanaticus]